LHVLNLFSADRPFEWLAGFLDDGIVLLMPEG